MSLIKSLLLGLVQGLAEFLPISSSGHLVLLETLFGFEDGGDLFFDVLLHFATLIAVFVAYRKEVLEMIREFFAFLAVCIGKGGKGARETKEEVPPARRLILLIILATLPLVLVLPVKDVLESARAYPWIVGIALLATGCILFFSDRYGKTHRGRKTERSATWKDALLVGVMQAVAVMPGVSRSGSTISMGIFRGFERNFAVRFSFLLSIPAVLGATLVETVDAVQAGIQWNLVPLYLAGMLVAGVSGYFAIKLVRYITNKGKFGWFAFYCWAVGLITVIASLATA